MAVAALTAAIVALSIVPGEPQPGDSAFAWAVARTPTLLQKLMHVVVYGLLTMLLVWALEAAGWSPLRAYACGVFVAVALGALLEWVQLSVPGRFGTLYDLALNVAGVICGLTLFIVLRGDAFTPP